MSGDMSAKSVDSHNMRQVILDVPQQFTVGLNLADALHFTETFSSITISGMGGSALPGDVLQAYVNDLAKQGKTFVAIHQNRSYALPPEAYQNSLNIISSYSGTTEETISSFQQALKHHLACVGVSSGGIIEEMCRDNGVPHVKIPAGIQPRMATGYFFGAFAKIMIRAGLLPDFSSEISSLADTLKQKVQALEKTGKELGEKLQGKIPIVYATNEMRSVAMIWKIKINENAKMPAFWNVFPELNHNEMNGYENASGDFFVVMLVDPDDHPQILKRFAVTERLLHERGIAVQRVEMEGKTVFEKIFLSLSLGEWTSYYLALAIGQDPTPVQMVEQLKKMLK